MGRRRRRIKWRGAFDGLACLQRPPAAIQLLLKATFEKPVSSANNTERKSRDPEKERRREREGEQVRVKNGNEEESEIRRERK